MPSTAITTFTNILYFPTVELIQNTPPTLIGYEPADLTVHPPLKTIEGGFIFFAYVSSVAKKFSPKKKWIL